MNESNVTIPPTDQPSSQNHTCPPSFYGSSCETKGITETFNGVMSIY